MANLQPVETQHLSQAINPRLQRRDEKLNEQLMPISCVQAGEGRMMHCER
jgi:hypothetical protein